MIVIGFDGFNLILRHWKLNRKFICIRWIASHMELFSWVMIFWMTWISLRFFISASIWQWTEHFFPSCSPSLFFFSFSRLLLLFPYWNIQEVNNLEMSEIYINSGKLIGLWYSRKEICFNSNHQTVKKCFQSQFQHCQHEKILLHALLSLSSSHVCFWTFPPSQKLTAQLAISEVFRISCICMENDLCTRI